MTVRMSESVLPDPDDVRIIRALQVGPRATFAEIGAAVQLSEVAAARRYRRLAKSGVVHVTGLVDVAGLGQSQWWIRIRCRPEAVHGVADALAGRDDVTWIGISGPGEITCLIGSRDHTERDDLLATRLPRTKAVLELEPTLIMHRFLDARAPVPDVLRGELLPVQEAGLTVEPSIWTQGGVAIPVPRGEIAPDRHDEKLMAALAHNGRASLVELASASGLTPGRVVRRLEVLLEHRVLHVTTQVSGPALGLHAPAVLRVRVHPTELKRVGEVVAEMAETTSVDATTGRAGLHVVVACRDLEHLFAFATDRIGPLPGVQDLEIAPVLDQVKQGGSRLGDGLFLGAGQR